MQQAPRLIAVGNGHKPGAYDYIRVLLVLHKFVIHVLHVGR